jgi:hypothetical protein
MLLPASCVPLCHGLSLKLAVSLRAVDVPEAIRLWPLAVNMAACHVAGLGLGWLQVKTLNTPASLASQITVMTALGNIGGSCWVCW